MGALFSLAGTMTRTSKSSEIVPTESCKRQRMSSCLFYESPRLIPSLPDEISFQILARIPRIWYLNAKLVSRRWKTAVMSPEVFQVRKELGITEEWLYFLTKVKGDKFVWLALDPLSKIWQRLPPMPNVVYEEESEKGLSGLRMLNVVGSSIKFAALLMGWLGGKNTLDQMSFCGCAIGAVDGCLYVLGGFFKASTMRCVWRYDPTVNSWSEVTPMTIGRAYCKTGLLNNKLYAVGGVSRGRGGLNPLLSAEVFDPCTGIWTQVPRMPFSRAQVLPTAFLAGWLKPIVTGMISYRGRLCVPQSLYSWPFFVDVGGEIYDPETNAWAEMPTGMGEGWPVRQAGTKLSVVINEELYALDPSSSLENSKIKIYNPQEDAWKVIIGKVPIHDFSDSESPYLLAGFLGNLHVITKDSSSNVVVLQADLQKNVGPNPSTSSPPSKSLCQTSDSLAEEETDVWKVIATKNFGSAELVSCQVLVI